ncbi:MAG: C4-type zinc ribbon domain-containing protein [Bacteroidales bacterium]|jgi:uncharacterized protein|nr:C4-type zinc ribbon domain-containing protein [Bacteroidales bacterium]MDD2205236.1 C4-type zinc ribbon domain-containing protein [Bacteroidales bacterium]MDD3152726.1 C4-type zinc ribbon domain-containing protein [Bacteroidales bacterium]MDD3914687.1 C4-type zinc ribbon domain-containing protein [Bacteroidales bacterium]MDD4633408.1 C4-type zinc ribbon domain-containing protein [Bacteroidales bacterium]
MVKKKDVEVPQVQSSVASEVIIENASEDSNSAIKPDVTIEKKLESLYALQLIDSKIDNIRTARGELPLEVQDLEDAIVGLETRIDNYKTEIAKHTELINEQNTKIAEASSLIKKYSDQQMNVRNNREYDSLTKELEYQNLEVQLSEKKIKDSSTAIEKLKLNIEIANKNLAQEKEDLAGKRSELDSIIVETENEEKALLALSEEYGSYIEQRLLTAYTRIRKSVRNGLAVVPIERDACAGCFNKIPPQRQLDIKMHKKIIVCEFCGRILVDSDIANEVKANTGEKLQD